MKNYKFKCRLYVLIFLFIPFLSNAQFNNSNSSQNINAGWTWGIYPLKSVLLNETSQSNDAWSEFGLGVDIRYLINSHLGIESRLSYRVWNDFDRTHLPLTIGPYYQFSFTAKTSFSIFGGIGPSGILGNDYAGVFAAFETGIRVEQRILNNKKLFLGSSYGQGMSFHPDHFEYLDIFIGIQF